MPDRSSATSNAARGTSFRSAQRRTTSGKVGVWDTALTDGDWEAWRAHLRNRPLPRPWAELTPRQKTPLAWSVPVRCGEEVPQLLQSAGRAPQLDVAALQELARAAEALPHRPTDDAATFGFTCLAWAHLLPRLADVMTAEAWRTVLQSLVRAAEESAAISLDDDPLGRLLLGGELPWSLAYQFSELEVCRRLATPASTTLSAGLVELLDGEGVPSASHLPLLRPLLALWTRCGILAREKGKECYTREARVQYNWLVQRAIQLSRPDGGALLTTDESGAWRPELFEAALALSDDAQDEALAHTMLPLRKAPREPVRRGPASAFHSEWAEVGLLQPAAERLAPRLVVAYGERSLPAELTNRSQVVFSGPWAPQVVIDGQPLEPDGDWEEVCWVSDEDVDYLEVEMSFLGGWRVQRQMLLARKDTFLFVADAVLGKTRGTIEYRLVTPLASSVTFIGEDQTRDGVLHGLKPLATVLPLALPEWRRERGVGELEAGEQGLTLKMTAAGQALFAPLFFDLSTRRLKKERTWRRLTVAERLTIQPADVAVGYRVQVAAEQWLFYRSLAKAANRTVLGQNLASEFVAARFTSQGYADELVSISSE